MSGGEAVILDNIKKSYNGKAVLNGLTLEAERGQPVCLFGQSGCGKTTALNIIAGLTKADGGNITGNEGRISYVFQEDRLLEQLSVKENIMLTACNRKAADGFIAAAGLSDCIDMYPADMSGGMKRRTAIARAVAFDGGILLLDEPFNGIDEKRKEAIAEFLKSFASDKICIMVTHDRADAGLMGAKIFEIIDNNY